MGDPYFQVQKSVEDMMDELRDQVADPHYYEDQKEEWKGRMRLLIRHTVENTVSWLTYKEILQAVHEGIEESFCDQPDWDKYAGQALSSLAE